MAELDFIHKKVAGLPVGIWLLIIAGGVVVGVMIRKRAEAGSSDTTDQQSSDQTATDTGGDVVPYSDLASEDYGGYPMTGGGPPSVYGGGAIKLDPGTLTIRVIQKKRGGGKHHPHHGAQHPHHKSNTA